MKLFIDTANVDEIRAAAELGVICGVTTNPTLIAKYNVALHCSDSLILWFKVSMTLLLSGVLFPLFSIIILNSFYL